MNRALANRIPAQIESGIAQGIGWGIVAIAFYLLFKGRIGV